MISFGLFVRGIRQDPQNSGQAKRNQPKGSAVKHVEFNDDLQNSNETYMEYGSLRPPLGDGYSMEASGTIIIVLASCLFVGDYIFETTPTETHRLDFKLF